MLRTCGAEGFKGRICDINKKGIKGIIGIGGELEIVQSEQINIIRKEKNALTSHNTEMEKSLNETKVVKQNRMLASLKHEEKHDKNFFFIRPPDSEEVYVFVNKSGGGNTARDRRPLEADIHSHDEDLTMVNEEDKETHLKL